MKSRADIVLETGELNSNQLRSRINELFGETEANETMRTTLLSFGFKHGLPLDVDIVLDVRFLPNPYWDEELRELSGLDEDVKKFVLGQPETEEFVQKTIELFEPLLPLYSREGKSYLTIGIGCTGGRHRSVALTEELGRRLRVMGHPLSTFHRDIDR